MTRIHMLLIATLVGTASTILVGQPGPTAAALFQQGLLLERAEGNVTQAIVLFERVVAEFPNDRTVVPQALSHLAQVYEKQNDPRAFRMWTRLASDYGATPYADEARRRLAVIATAQAGPFHVRVLDGIPNGDELESISPDGRQALFQKDDVSLWLRDIASGKERLLHRDPPRIIGSTEWSPDSKRVAVVSLDARVTASAPNPHADLRVVALDGGATRNIVTAVGPRAGIYWSPNGRSLVTQMGIVAGTASGEIRLVDAVTGQSRKIAGASRPTDWFAWSPDSKQLVFETTDQDSKDSYFIVNVESGDPRPWPMPINLADGRVNLAAGVTRTWTTDNRVLVRQAGGAKGNTFYLIPAAGGAAEKTCGTSSTIQCLPVMSPDGKVRVGSDNSTKRLLLFDTPSRAGGPRRVTTGFANESGPHLSPDGRLLLFESNPDGEAAVYVVPVDHSPSSSPIRVMALEGGTSFTVAAWTADGRVVASLFHDTNDVYRINIDKNGKASGVAGRLTQDTMYNDDPAISPEGNQIAYWSDKGVHLMTIDGANERPILAQAFGGPKHLQWRSASDVLFQRTDAAAKAVHLMSLDIRTGATQTFAELPMIAGFWQFIPSRNEVFYVPAAATDGVYTLHARSLASGADRVVATVPNIVVPNMVSSTYTFRVSPDARQIAYGRWAGTADARTIELHVMAIDGTGDRIVGTPEAAQRNWGPSGYPYDWSPDGRFLLYDGSPGRLKVLDVRSGESWAIAQATDDGKIQWSGAQWSPDGSFIAISRYGWREEWRALDGLTYDAVVKLMDAAARR